MPVALEDQDPARVEELDDVRRQRRAAGDGVLQPAAEAFLDLPEDQPVGKPELKGEEGPGAAAALADA